MIKQEQVLKLFNDGYCCAAITFGVCAEKLGLDFDTAVRIPAAYGYGIGHGNTCGAVTGGIMALGLKYGNDTYGDIPTKEAFGRIRQEYEKAFIEKNGCLLCKELLGRNPEIPEELAYLRAHDVSRKKCPTIVANACAILERMLDIELDAKGGHDE